MLWWLLGSRKEIVTKNNVSRGLIELTEWVGLIQYWLIEAETNGRYFPDDIFKCIFLYENVFISIKISPRFVPKGQINNIPSLV